MRVTYSYSKASSYGTGKFVRLIMVTYLSIRYNVAFGFFYLFIKLLVLAKNKSLCGALNYKSAVFEICLDLCTTAVFIGIRFLKWCHIFVPFICFKKQIDFCTY